MKLDANALQGSFLVAACVVMLLAACQTAPPAPSAAPAEPAPAAAPAARQRARRIPSRRKGHVLGKVVLRIR